MEDKALERISSLIANGIAPAQAAEMAGIPRKKFRRLYREGSEIAEQDDPLDCLSYRLWLAVVEGKGKAVGKAVSLINQQAEDGNFKAAAWIAEHVAPEDYSEGAKEQEQMDAFKPITVAVGVLEDSKPEIAELPEPLPIEEKGV